MLYRRMVCGLSLYTGTASNRRSSAKALFPQLIGISAPGRSKRLRGIFRVKTQMCVAGDRAGRSYRAMHISGSVSSSEGGARSFPRGPTVGPGDRGRFTVRRSSTQDP